MPNERTILIETLFRKFDETSLDAFRDVSAETKQDGSTVTRVDREISAFALELLKKHTPDHGVISEEETVPYRPEAEWQWVIDPLDGTASFARGFPTWGLGLGLVHRGEPVEGYLRFPVLGETYQFTEGTFFADGKEQKPSGGVLVADTRNILVGSSLQHQSRLERLTGAKVRNLGSILYHLICLAMGRTEAVVANRFAVWDLAAALPFTRARGCVERFADGRPFSLLELLTEPGENSRHPRPLVIGPPAEVEAIIAEIR
ncbi:MAG: hypothetical protein IIA14_02095 [SAR324 cluster bacterium]|nr:hypothetical protein [SAR324 cluster bacterium]